MTMAFLFHRERIVHTTIDRHVANQVHAEKPESLQAAERRLVRRLQRGDVEAFECLFQRYSGRIYRQAMALLGNAAEAEEIVQDVFFTLYTKIGTFRGNAGLATWLYRLAANASLSRLRWRRRRPEVSFQDYMPHFDHHGQHRIRPVVDWSSDLERHAIHAQALCLLQQALNELPPLDKAVVILAELEGFANRRIGSILGLTESAVKSRRHRACLFLRGRLATLLSENAV
jgi:RNA polymerase sigma-70 factor (ECF subfamily)